MMRDMKPDMPMVTLMVKCIISRCFNRKLVSNLLIFLYERKVFVMKRNTVFSKEVSRDYSQGNKKAFWEEHKAEIIASTVLSGGLSVLGILLGNHIGIAGGGSAIKGSIPLGIGGGLIGAAGGSRLGAEIDKKRKSEKEESDKHGPMYAPSKDDNDKDALIDKIKHPSIFREEKLN